MVMSGKETRFDLLRGGGRVSELEWLPERCQRARNHTHADTQTCACTCRGDAKQYSEHNLERSNTLLLKLNIKSQIVNNKRKILEFLATA